MCFKHPNIIKETEVLIHGLCHKWSSTQTFLALTLFRETSKFWIQEVLKDEIVGQMAAPLAEDEDVLAINEEYIFFMMMTRFLLLKEAKQQAGSLAAYTYANGNSKSYCISIYRFCNTKCSFRSASKS